MSAPKQPEPTAASEEYVYVPPIEDAATEAVSRLRVVLHMLDGIDDEVYEDCDGYESTVIKAVIGEVITLLRTSLKREQEERAGCAEEDLP